jgi:hypothetical protein
MFNLPSFQSTDQFWPMAHPDCDRPRPTLWRRITSWIAGRLA